MNKKIVSMLVALFLTISALSAVSGDGSDPLDPSDGGADWDGDGLTNAEEQNHGTNMNNADSDGDGLPDGWEVNNGCLLYTSPSPRDATLSRMPSSA